MARDPNNGGVVINVPEAVWIAWIAQYGALAARQRIKVAIEQVMFKDGTIYRMLDNETPASSPSRIAPPVKPLMPEAVHDERPVKPPVKSMVPELEHNERGPLLSSDKFKEMYTDIRANLNGKLTAWEIEFLEDKLNFAHMGPQVWFTLVSGRHFENICYKAGVPCPFHIKPSGIRPDA